MPKSNNPKRVRPVYVQPHRAQLKTQALNLYPRNIPQSKDITDSTRPSCTRCLHCFECTLFRSVSSDRERLNLCPGIGQTSVFINEVISAGFIYLPTALAPAFIVIQEN